MFLGERIHTPEADVMARLCIFAPRIAEANYKITIRHAGYFLNFLPSKLFPEPGHNAPHARVHQAIRTENSKSEYGNIDAAAKGTPQSIQIDYALWLGSNIGGWQVRRPNGYCWLDGTRSIRRWLLDLRRGRRSSRRRWCWEGRGSCRQYSGQRSGLLI